MELNEVFNEFITNEDFLKEYSHEEIMKGTYLETGRDDMQRETVMNMYKNGLTKEEISKYAEIPLDIVISILQTK